MSINPKAVGLRISFQGLITRKSEFEIWAKTDAHRLRNLFLDNIF